MVLRPRGRSQPILAVSRPPAEAQQVEVRTFEGELIGKVSLAAAREMVAGKLADQMKHGLSLKLGIRWLPSRFDRPSGRPDLKQMERRDPGRYTALWRGTRDAVVGKGALGRRTIDKSVRFASKDNADHA